MYSEASLSLRAKGKCLRKINWLRGEMQKDLRRISCLSIFWLWVVDSSLSSFKRVAKDSRVSLSMDFRIASDWIADFAFISAGVSYR